MTSKINKGDAFKTLVFNGAFFLLQFKNAQGFPPQTLDFVDVKLGFAEVVPQLIVTSDSENDLDLELDASQIILSKEGDVYLRIITDNDKIITTISTTSTN